MSLSRRLPASNVLMLDEASMLIARLTLIMIYITTIASWSIILDILVVFAGPKGTGRSAQIYTALAWWHTSVFGMSMLGILCFEDMARRSKKYENAREVLGR
ncbi:hypothetical protein OCU04_004217 [Sclerotinia nivalis]|uniref:Uncharacterized protein n=1 Tax=Sclerotinia nivalis TaxID=352851 RepID=A0A9X0AQD2_9HELO|nr:hypothetical protein OCU04_004217 [Sclerotinia nivalis]